jgi:hypothetical protein
MLQFFSSSTNIVNSKRAITECLENALEGQGNLDCDLIIIYSAIGHNFQDLLNEARKLSPNARIAGCTGSGIIGKDGPDESMKALAIMAIKGPKDEFALAGITMIEKMDPYEMGFRIAQDLKSTNPNISMIHFLPSAFGLWPADKAIEGIESVFGIDMPIFGGVSIDNMKGISCFQFFDGQVFERGAVAVGFADPTLKFISHSNHGFGVMEGMSLEMTRCNSNIIYEFNRKPAWNVLTETLGLPVTASYIEALIIAGFAKELPEELQEEYGSKYILFGIMGKNEDNSIGIPNTCKEGMKIWLTKRDEKKMFDGVDQLVQWILASLNGKKPLAVFHADCVMRGRFSLNRILKDEIINRLQVPLCKGEKIPWLGLYSGGEFAMIGKQNFLHGFSSSLFVIYR